MSETTFNTGKVSVALIGHTNVGKTTTVRTLAKASFGEISDSAHTTTEAKAYEALQAIFWDCPGFQHAAAFLSYLQLQETLKANGAAKIKAAFPFDFHYDELAIATIEKADVALYIASLEVVPDDSYAAEVKLIQTKQPKIIGVLNKHGLVWGSGKIDVSKRVEQWRQLLGKHGIKDIIVFDAYWDSPLQVLQIYQSIEALLLPKKRKRFSSDLAAFKEHQQKIRKKACLSLAECVIDCRSIEMTAYSSTDGYDEGQTRRRVEENVKIQTERRLSTFVQKVIDLYGLATPPPTFLFDKCSLIVRKTKNESERVATVASNVLLGTSAGAAVGAVLGGLLGSVFGPGGTVAGAMFGAKVAAVFGATGGVSGAVYGASTPTNTVFSARPDNALLQGVANTGIAVIFGISHHGFGLSPYMLASHLKNFVKRLEDVNEWNLSADWWLIATQEHIAILCEKNLDKWDNEPRVLQPTLSSP